jgi:outer membrane biosynthesis protein TonB
MMGFTNFARRLRQWILHKPACSGIPLRMTFRRQFAVLLVALAVLLGSACQQKKPQLPAKMQAPTLAVSVPDQIPEIALPPEPPAQQQQAAVEEPPPKKPPPKHHNSKKPAQPPVTQANAQANAQANPAMAANRPPANPVVETPADTAIAAAVTSQQLNRQKQTTAELLDSTEKDLKGLNQSLSHDEESMLAQIKSYIAQSHKATSDGDFERAYNLAMKAHLLTDALLKK